jgi:hypothetical protein
LRNNVTTTSAGWTLYPFSLADDGTSHSDGGLQIATVMIEGEEARAIWKWAKNGKDSTRQIALSSVEEGASADPFVIRPSPTVQSANVTPSAAYFAVMAVADSLRGKSSFPTPHASFTESFKSLAD